MMSSPVFPYNPLWYVSSDTLQNALKAFRATQRKSKSGVPIVPLKPEVK